MTATEHGEPGRQSESTIYIAGSLNWRTLNPSLASPL